LLDRATHPLTLEPSRQVDQMELFAYRAAHDGVCYIERVVLPDGRLMGGLPSLSASRQTIAPAWGAGRMRTTKCVQF